MTRAEAIELGYQASDTDMPYTEFKEMLKTWHIKPIEKYGKPIGVFFNKNAQIHFSILKEYRKRWANRQIVKDFIEPVFKAYNFVITTVPDTKPYGHKIVQKFGFEYLTKQDTYTVYKLESLKWV